jgi:uncharacterized metal-binding protein
MKKKESPAAKNVALVYSCSGCSNLAQMANDMAISLHRAGMAEMSCIAGVGGDVKPLVKKALSGVPIIAIDGCHLHCVKACLRRHGIEPSVHHTLSDFDARKKFYENYDDAEFDRIFSRVKASLPEMPAMDLPAG